MNNKKILIAAGVVAVSVAAYLVWKEGTSKENTPKLNNMGVACPNNNEMLVDGKCQPTGGTRSANGNLKGIKMKNANGLKGLKFKNYTSGSFFENQKEKLNY